MKINNGVDIVEIKRIEKILLNNRESFLNKIFNEKEIEYFKKRNYNVQTISGYFASKEAISKALGTGFGKISFKDIEIIKDENNSPSFLLRNNALEIFKENNFSSSSLSISHEKEYAIAFAIIY